MGIKEAIKQTEFKHEYEKLAVNLTFTSNFLNAHFADLLKPFDLTQPQFNVLRILRGQYPNAASVNLLIERMIDRSSNASRIVDKLETKKLVTRKACPKDRRRMDVKITENGLFLLEKLDSELEKFFTVFEHLSQKEARTLNQLLDKLRKE
ncbi:MAG: MarR family transcriptional regulator [Bacteroidetes bacterium]|nr:MarR family transcriptional regulator [Bacteroidota bacterium]